jgi:hypothetical protein
MTNMSVDQLTLNAALAEHGGEPPVFDIMTTMAVPAKMDQNGSPDVVEPEYDHVQLRVAELLGQNKSRFDVARILEHHLLTPLQRTKNRKDRRRFALRKIRRWQKRKDFRDLVWQYSLERLDSRTPAILDGVANRATHGRVDAAKFALELSGRYTPKGQDTPTQVAIVVNGVPRPDVRVQAVAATEQAAIQPAGEEL